MVPRDDKKITFPVVNRLSFNTYNAEGSWLHFMYQSNWHEVRRKNIVKNLLCSVLLSVTDIFYLTQEYIEDIQRYVVGYEIYFTSETGFFFIFTSAKQEWKYIKKILSHKWNKFHIQLQNVEFSVCYIFLHETSNFKLPAPKQYQYCALKCSSSKSTSTEQKH